MLALQSPHHERQPPDEQASAPTQIARGNILDRFAGVLLGTALGDALGLPMEGLPAAAIARRFPSIDRYHLLGRTGFVSDDTEQSALVAQALARYPDDKARFVRAFRRSLLGWFARLPWGIGFGTLRACLRIAVGVRQSGVSSADDEPTQGLGARMTMRSGRSNRGRGGDNNDRVTDLRGRGRFAKNGSSSRPDRGEAEFLRAYRPADFPRPSVTVDIAAFSILDAELRVLLIRRGEYPFKGAWALPGGFVRVGDGHRDQGEDLDASARRELEEETGLRAGDVFLDQVGAFGRAGRDPRMRVITVAFCALIRPDLVPLVKAGGDATLADWIPVDRLGSTLLAFDHTEIIRQAISHVASLIDSTDIASSLVPKTFTIQELRHVHTVLTGKQQDPGNFRRRFERMLEDGVIEKSSGKRLTASRPAFVYRFVPSDGSSRTHTREER